MSTIRIKVVDQVLKFRDMPVISAGDQNVDRVQFDCDNFWDGYIKVAVFFQQKGELSYAMVNADGSCSIPNSIMRLKGRIYISLTGTNTKGQVRTSNILAYKVEDGIVDASIDDEFPGEISDEEKTDIYNQILAMFQDMTNRFNELASNFAYVRIEGANEFEYDEFQLEAKMRVYAYSREDINAMLTPLDDMKQDIATLQQFATNAGNTFEDIEKTIGDNMNATIVMIEEVKEIINNRYNELLERIQRLEAK